MAWPVVYGSGGEDGEGFVGDVFDAGDDVPGCSGGVQQLVEDGFAGGSIAASGDGCLYCGYLFDASLMKY